MRASLWILSPPVIFLGTTRSATRPSPPMNSSNSFYINICFKCHFHMHLCHLSLHISIRSKCEFIQAFVLPSVTSYNQLCQVSIYISICDAKCHITTFNKTLTCLMYKNLYIHGFTYSIYFCISKLNCNFSTYPFNQTTTIDHLFNGLLYVFFHFLIKFYYYY